MRSLVALLVVAATAATAHAQPGTVDPDAPPVYVQPGYRYQPTLAPRSVALTQEEVDLLDEGTIGTGRAIVGGVVASVYGFGIGHSVQGRWLDMGWVFTLGEVASFTAIIYGIAQINSCESYYTGDVYVDTCEHGNHGNDRAAGYLVGGLLAFGGFRVWEIIDAWVGPKRHNAKVRAVRRKVDPSYDQQNDGGYGFYLKPNHDTGGGMAGLSLKF